MRSIHKLVVVVVATESAVGSVPPFSPGAVIPWVSDPRY